MPFKLLTAAGMGRRFRYLEAPIRIARESARSLRASDMVVRHPYLPSTGCSDRS